jgi:type IV pilus biogenesis protein PilP
LLQKVSRDNARLLLMSNAAKVETLEQEMAAKRLKFEIDQAKARAELAEAKMVPGSLVALPGAPGAGATGVPGASQAPAAPAPPSYTLLGVSSFGDRTLAELSSMDFGVMSVEPGTTLPDGGRVVSISPTHVVVRRGGKSEKIYIGTGASSSAASSGTKPAAAKPPVPAR